MSPLFAPLLRLLAGGLVTVVMSACSQPVPAAVETDGAAQLAAEIAELRKDLEQTRRENVSLRERVGALEAHNSLAPQIDESPLLSELQTALEMLDMLESEVVGDRARITDLDDRLDAVDSDIRRSLADVRDTVQGMRALIEDLQVRYEVLQLRIDQLQS